MLGRVAYGQTQYAHSGTSAAKTEFFQELLALAEVKSFLASKTFVSLVTILEGFSVKVFYMKIFTEYLLLVDSLRTLVSKTLQELLGLSEAIQKGVGKVLQELLSLSEDSSSILYKFKTLTENLVVSFIGGFSLQKSFLETVSILEDYASFLGGMVLREYLVVQDLIVTSASKTFADLIEVGDSIKKWLNGFYLRWDKRDAVTTSWTKTDSPDTTWEKRDIRKVED